MKLISKLLAQIINFNICIPNIYLVHRVSANPSPLPVHTALTCLKFRDFYFSKNDLTTTKEESDVVLFVFAFLIQPVRTHINLTYYNHRRWCITPPVKHPIIIKLSLDKPHFIMFEPCGLVQSCTKRNRSVCELFVSTDWRFFNNNKKSYSEHTVSQGPVHTHCNESEWNQIYLMNINLQNRFFE